MRKKSISKEKILDVASAIIKDNGVEACSIRNLANDAGIGIGTIYNYFTSHDLLLNEVFERSWGKTSELLKSINLENFFPEEKMCKYYYLLNEEILNRRSLGIIVLDMKILTEKVSIENSFIVKDIYTIFFETMKKTKRNMNCNDSELDLISRWIFMLMITNAKLPTEQQEIGWEIIKDRFL